jgi:hypothetical protein
MDNGNINLTKKRCTQKTIPGENKNIHHLDDMDPGLNNSRYN